MRDFNNNPLREAIAPMTLTSDNSSYGTLALRLHPAGIDKTLQQVQKIFTEIYPTYIYNCAFFDHRIGDFYRTEKMTAQLFKIAAILAIFISCLGLYGLVSFMVVQKTKEVGIRKVLGASVQNIVYLFSREFSLLISIAFLIAAPLAYYFMHHWLAGFYYHTSMGWGIFVLAITGSVLVAWLAVGYKAIRAALANPVKSLRVE
jgi:ABC-type antimicrobial peptide transport system permease subunit